MIYLQLFFSFLHVGLFSIGGGYAAMPLIQNQIVEAHSWMTMSEFTDLITIAEMTPGPIAVNSATFVGIRIAGIAGAIAATLGCIFPSLVIVPLLAYFYYHYKGTPMIQNVLSGLRPVVVSLIASAGISIATIVLFSEEKVALQNINWAGGAISLAAFVLLRKKKWNPILVMMLCGLSYLGINLLLQI